MARGRGILGSPKVGLTTKVESNQNRNLFIHVPFVDRQQAGITNGTFPNFKVNKGNFVVKWGDPNNRGRMVKHPTRGLWMPRPEQWGGGGGQCFLSLVRPNVTPGYNSNNKDYQTPKRFTVSIWFRQEVFAAQFVVLMGEIAPGYDSGGYNWWANWMVRLENNIKPRYYICDGTSSNYLELHAPVGSYSLNKDNHIVMTYDGATLKGYLNKEQVVSGAFSFGVGQNVGNIEIASCRQSLFNEFGLTGLVWDFRMYSEAFSPAQVRELYYYTNDLYADRKRGAGIVAGVEVNQTVTQSVTSSQTVSSNKNVNGSLVQSVTTSHTIRANRDYYATVTSTVGLTQRVNLESRASVSQSLSVTQTVDFDRSRFILVSVSHDMGVAQVIGTPRFSRVARVTQNLAMADILANNSTFVTHTLTLSQSISFIKEVNSRVTQTLSMLDTVFVNSPRLMSLYHNFLLYDSAVGRNSVTRISLVHSLSVTQSVSGRNGTFRVNVSQSVTTSQTLFRRDAIYRVNVSDTVSVTQRVNTHWRKKVEQDITVLQTVVGVREITRNLVATVDVSSSFDKTREIIRTLESHAEVTSTFGRSIEVTRTIVEQVGVKSNFTPVLIAGPGQFYLPPVTGGPPEFGAQTSPRIPIEGVETATGNIVRIEAAGSLILLPAPQLANELRPIQGVVTLRTQTGATQAYPITTGQEAFEYTFFLDRPKAYELRKWIEDNHSERMIITNWRGEKWQGFLITEEIDFTFEGVRAGNAAEKVVVPLSFRGVRV